MRRGREVDRERVLALLWLVGAAITAATLFLRYPPDFDETARASVAVVALVVGIALYLAPPLPDWVLHAVLVFGTFVVAFCAWHGVADVEGVMYMLPALYAFGAFPPRHAVWYMVLIGVQYAVVLSIEDAAHVVIPEAAWVLVMGAASVTGISVAMLVSLRERDRAHGERDRQIAEVLQRALLPGVLPAGEGFELAARYLAASREADVGGDFYEGLCLPDGRVALAIGDVAGKGLPAAAVVGRVRAALRAYAKEEPAPASVLDRLDDFLSSEPERAMVTLLYVVVHPPSGRVTWSSAGHLPPLLLPAGDDPRVLTGRPGAPLGVGAAAVHQEHEATVGPGDRLLLFTDGLVERRGSVIDDGVAGVARVLASLPGLDAERTLDAALRLMPTDRADDVALVLLGLTPVAAAPAAGAGVAGRRAMAG